MMMKTMTAKREELHWRAKVAIRRGVERVVRESLKPPPKLNLVEWADTYRYLPDNSAESGKWRTGRVEAARGPMLSITSPEVQEVTVMCCIQLMKALSIDTPIPTPNGWVTMGELRLGDLVFGADGKPYPVLGKSNIKTANRCFRVEFSDGTSVIADAGHKWGYYLDGAYVVGNTLNIINLLNRNQLIALPITPFNQEQRFIVNVTEVDPVPVQCIAVDSPDHLYLCGEGMIPTHNTELMINAALYYIHQEPSPIMYVAPKKETAEAWSKERFMKSINTTPVTKEVFSANRRGDGNTILQKQFPGGQISIVSAGNPTDLAMRACRIMLFDETDKYPMNVGAGSGGSGGEGDPIAVAWGRATTYGNRAKKVAACSPTVEGKSRIHQEYLRSDQRQFHQPCPHCGHAEPLDWEKHVVIPDNKHGVPIPEQAKIVCNSCGTEWSEGDRIKSIRKGYWVAKYPEITHHHGYQVSSMASPFTPLVALAREYVAAKDNPQSMKAFENTRLARVYREKGDAPDWQRLYERRETYKHQTVPAGGLMLVAGIDVQKDYIIYEVVAYGRKKRSWSIDIGVIDGHISEDATKEALSKWLEREYINHHGLAMTIELTLIDSSNDTQEVYNTVAQMGTPRLRAIKGVGSLTTMLGTPKPVQISLNGLRKDGGIKMWPLGVNVIKEQFYKWLMLSRPTDEALNEGAEWPTGYCHFPEWDDDYFKQITAEILVERADNRGFLVRQWEKIREHNHYLDCRVYARAAAAMLGIDRMGEESWQERERRYGTTGETQASTTGTEEAPQTSAPPTAASQTPSPQRKKRPAKFFGNRR